MRSSSQSQVSSSQKKINFSDLDFSLDEKKLWREYKKTLEKDHYFPLVLSFLSDFETPLSLCHKLKADFLLESVEMMESIGRYSIVASGIREKISFKGDNIDYSCIPREQKPNLKNHKLSKKISFISPDPLAEIQKHYLQRRVAEVSFDVPPFCGGLIGYMGFEVAGYFESISASKDVLNVPDAILIFPQLVAVYDNAKRIVSLIYLLASPFFSDELSFALAGNRDERGEVSRKEKNKKAKIQESEKLFHEGLAFLRNTQKQLLKEKVKLPIASLEQIEQAKTSWEKRKSNFTKKRYIAMVDKAKKYIRQGDIFQVVLSQRFSFPCSLSPFEIYRNLRRLNPSPYLYYLNFGELALVGSSPETMASLSGKELGVVPIAGTAARGKNTEEDEQLGQSLLSDEKECAEHLMLVDLGRNDLGRVASAGTVKLKRYMQLEKYSHVQHIVSEVVAERKAGVDAMDLVKATFPAGTLSGAPKVRAMQIISELEKEKRGPYGGIVFYLSLSGNFDSCITIRTLLLKDGVGYVQAGAGIVHDSKPESEYQECLNKSRVIFRAVEQAGMRVAEFNG